MSRRGGYVTALLLIAVGAALLLLSSTRPWWTVTTTASGMPTTSKVIDGRHAAPATVGLAVLGLAGIAGIVATRGTWRRAIGAVVALGGAVAAWSVVAASGDAGWRWAFAGDWGAITRTATHSLWPWPALAGALLLAVGGGLVVAFGGRWPGWSSRYEAAGVRQVDPEPSAHDLWDALDRGEDPTASPGVRPPRDLPE